MKDEQTEGGAASFRFLNKKNTLNGRVDAGAAVYFGAHCTGTLTYRREGYLADSAQVQKVKVQKGQL